MAKDSGISECFDHAERMASASEDEASRLEKLAERRDHKRYPYERELLISWATDGGVFDEPTTIRCVDISRGGIRILGRKMVYPESFGVIRLERPDGGVAPVGIRTIHTTYAGQMVHASGCRFVPIPSQVRNAIPAQLLR